MVINRYQKRLSGPLLDRIDITYGVVSRHAEVPRVPFQKLSSIASTTSAAASRRRPNVGRRRSATIRARVEAARARQTARFASVKDGQGAGLTTNADMGPTQVRDHCPVDETGRRPGDEPPRAGVSPRAEAGADDRVSFVGLRTGLAGSERIQPAHIAMSIFDRPRSTFGRPRRME